MMLEKVSVLYLLNRWMTFMHNIRDTKSGEVFSWICLLPAATIRDAWMTLNCKQMIIGSEMILTVAYNESELFCFHTQTNGEESEPSGNNSYYLIRQ